MSDAWLAELHGFDWLRDLRAVGGDAARRRARDLVGDWIERQTSWQEIAWRPDVLATRLHAWLGQHDFFCASADDLYRRRYHRHHRPSVQASRPGLCPAASRGPA